MLAVQSQPGSMSRAPPPTESAAIHRYYNDGRPSYPSTTSLPSVGPPPRPLIELPHPVEPRTGSHHASHPSIQEGPPGPPRHLEGHLHNPSASRSGLTVSVDSRPMAPSLPGLRDILTPPTGLTSSSVGYSPWSASRPSPPTHPSSASSAPRSAVSGDMYHSPLSTWHPPMALHAPPESVQHYHTSTERRMDAALTERSSGVRGPPVSTPVQPYNPYTEGRDYHDGRSERFPAHTTATPLSYHSNTATYSYPSNHDNAHFNGSAILHDQSQLHPDANAASESQRKYVGIKEIPGEGSFHVYEGGYRLPTHVDGEQVNPAWGLTKANKPRKRLALACLDCREKKIKCEPGQASCLQCEKAKRPCRRAPAQLAASESGSSIPWSNATASPPPHMPRTYPETSPRNGMTESEYADPSGRRDPPHSPLEPPAKKLRSASPNPHHHHHHHHHQNSLSNSHPQSHSYPNQRHLSHDAPGLARYGNAYSPPPPPRPVSRELGWDEDPCVVNRDATLHLAELYFSNVNNAVFNIYPRATFMHWLATCADKTPEERMVVYALLAVGARFAEPVLADFGRCCGDVAAHAISLRHSHCGLLDVQTRLLRCLYDSARGKDDAAWESLGAAIRGVTGKRLRLNLEKSCLADTDGLGASRLAFGMNPDQLAECHRRTFWACFLMDRFSGGSHCAISNQNVFVRLPCDEDGYERGRASDAPLFNDTAANTLSLAPMNSRMSAMAWLVLFASVWGNVLDFLHRAPHRPENMYREEYDEFYARTHDELQHILSRLPEHLQYSVANLQRSLRDGYAGWFVTMHTLHHFILLRLNRRMRHHLMLGKVARNIRAAHYHGHSVLAITADLTRAKGEVTAPHGQRMDVPFSSPFPSAMVVEAIDVVSAGGFESSLSATMEAIEAGVCVLRELSAHWAAAVEQARTCQKRIYQIRNILSHPFKAKSGCWLGREWGMIDPLEANLDLEEDCIYGPCANEGTPNAVYFDALKDTHHDRGHSRAGVRAMS